MELNNYGEYSSSLINVLKKEVSIYQDEFKLCNYLGKDKCYKIIEIIKDFIKSKKRVIYGGMAINASLPEKEKIYSGENYDFDIYSSTPKRDLVELVNRLSSLDVPYLSGMESGHPGVFKLFIYFLPIVDITFLPQYIIDKIPLFEENGFYYPQPQFLKNDILLSLTNNIYSSYRWEKDYSRYALLNKYYQFERPTGFSCERNSSQLNRKIKEILEFIKNQENAIITLSYAYQFYKKENELVDLFNLFSPFVSIYHNNPEEFIDLLKKKSNKSIIFYKKYEPFLRYMPTSYDVYIDDENPVLRIYNSQGLCIPYHTLQNIKVVSMGKLLLDVKVNEFLCKIENKEKEEKLYKCMAYEIDRMNRTTYKENKMDFNSLFSLLSNKCEGKQFIEGFLIQDKEKKRINRFDYSPSKNKSKYLNSKQTNSGSIRGFEAKELK